MENIKKFIELVNRKRELKAEEKRINEQINELQESVISVMADNGVQNINMDGHTVYIRRELFASCRDLEAIRNYEPSLVKESVNAQTLAAWVRELVDCGEWKTDDQGMPVLPDMLEEAIKITEKIEARARKSQ